MSTELLTILERLEHRLSHYLIRAENALPPAPPPIDWQASAYRWRVRGNIGALVAVGSVADIALDALKNIAPQKDTLMQNLSQFVQGLPANNVLLTGARGTGKSSLVRACLQHFAPQGLRLVEMDKDHLESLPDVLDLLATRSERYMIYIDDLSFEQGEASYKAMKSVLDGSIAVNTDNVLIIASSNRRHLMPEHHSENATYKHQDDGEIHPGDVVEEKISLSERFGIWLSFHPFRQDDFLGIVAHWLKHYGCEFDDDARYFALQWALQRASRSGRVAHQFAKDWAGKARMGIVQKRPDAIRDLPPKR